MKIKYLLYFLLLIPSVMSYGNSDTFFPRQKHSLIPWENLEPEKWLNFNQWNLKKDQPASSTVMGMMVNCIGECRIYRKTAFVKGRFLSQINEGDEIRITGESYAWVILLDGTLVRLNPFTSLSFLEFTLGEKEHFIHARLNRGNISWLARNDKTFLSTNKSDTDQLFLPLPWKKANRITTMERYITNLNKMIKKTNKLGHQKPTTSLIVMPNGMLLGKNIQAHLITHNAWGDSSFVRQHSHQEQGYNTEESTHPATFIFFSSKDYKEEILPLDQWVEIGLQGESLNEIEETEHLRMNHFLIKRIYTLNMMRELFIQQKTIPLFQTERSKAITKYGFQAPQKTLEKRINFLLGHNRLTERVYSAKFFHYFKKQNSKIKPPASELFFRKALNYFKIKSSVQ